MLYPYSRGIQVVQVCQNIISIRTVNHIHTHILVISWHTVLCIPVSLYCRDTTPYRSILWNNVKFRHMMTITSSFQIILHQYAHTCHTPIFLIFKIEINDWNMDHGKIFSQFSFSQFDHYSSTVYSSRPTQVGRAIPRRICDSMHRKSTKKNACCLQTRWSSGYFDSMLNREKCGTGRPGAPLRVATRSYE